MGVRKKQKAKSRLEELERRKKEFKEGGGGGKSTLPPPKMALCMVGTLTHS